MSPGTATGLISPDIRYVAVSTGSDESEADATTVKELADRVNREEEVVKPRVTEANRIDRDRIEELRKEPGLDLFRAESVRDALVEPLQGKGDGGPEEVNGRLGDVFRRRMSTGERAAGDEPVGEAVREWLPDGAAGESSDDIVATYEGVRRKAEAAREIETGAIERKPEEELTEVSNPEMESPVAAAEARTVLEEAERLGIADGVDETDPDGGARAVQRRAANVVSFAEGIRTAHDEFVDEEPGEASLGELAQRVADAYPTVEEIDRRTTGLDGPVDEPPDERTGGHAIR